MEIFSGTAGAVAVSDAEAIPFMLQIGDDTAETTPNSNWKGFTGFQAIVTDIGVQQNGGYQFRHTMADFVYAYIFGERLGEMVVRGLAFAADCEALALNAQWGEAGDFAPQHHGLEWVQAYYLANRLAKRGRPIVIVLGVDMKFQAFLLGFDFNIANRAEAPHVADFQLKFRLVPDGNIVSIDPRFGTPSLPPVNQNNDNPQIPPPEQLPEDPPTDDEIVELYWPKFGDEQEPPNIDLNIGIIRETNTEGDEITLTLPDWVSSDAFIRAGSSDPAPKSIWDYLDNQ